MSINYKKIGVLLCISIIMMGFSAYAESTIPEEIHSVISSALNQADRIGATNETEVSQDLIKSVQEDFSTAEGLIEEYSLSGEISEQNADILKSFLKIWQNLIAAYGYMIDGGMQKLEGYNAILGNETNRYETALEGFESAKENYAKAYESLNETKVLLTDINSDEIVKILPNASIPVNADINKMQSRLIDNGMICQAYQDLCKAEIAKVSSGDANSTAVQEPLNAATTLMKKLIPSPYVGGEASLFANITLS